MSRFIKKQGFTLIELMVVIVIIGVLASLAIPRFSEASAKAKVAEAPRVIASWESAFLAYNAETGSVDPAAGDLIFEVPSDSKWFTYSGNAGSVCTATPRSRMGAFLTTNYLISLYQDGGTFSHNAQNVTSAKKMVPNFFKN